ncbi:MAG: hypothetical protein JXA99_09425 [Candidatus Lokiarchaeota archaeon]|nr:hypothetical protein [Candidatus Lokiarchaeota archaeon]
MLIDPKVTRLDIFNNGGAIVQREIKLSLHQGINEFQIQNVPASFDPNSAEIKLEYLRPEDKELIKLQQTITTLPDKNNANQEITREKSAANNIISYSIDFTREMREKISEICESSSYRTYADMIGTFDFIINSKISGDIIVNILYFINDIRIKWSTSLIVKISNNNTPEIEGFIIVDNQTGFSYENVDLGFAIFELPEPTSYSVVGGLSNVNLPEQAYGQANINNNFYEVQNKLKRTQRYKQIK